MNRLFGASKQTAKPDLTQVSANIDDRVDSVEKKIAKLDEEIKKVSTQMNKMRDGAAKNSLKQKAIRLLRQRKVLMQQSEQLGNQSFNISQTNFTLESLKDTKSTVDAMKATNKQMKRELGKINIDDVLNVQDDLADHMSVADEIQNALGENYALPDVDDAELEAEFAALGDDLDTYESGLDAPSVPTSVLPEDGGAVPATGSKTDTGGVAVDEFGLPQIS